MAYESVLDRLAAGEFILEEIAPEIFKLLHEQSAVDALSSHKPMKRSTMRLRRQTESVDPATVEELGVKPKSKPAWDHVTITAETIASMTIFTEEELEDTDEDTLAFTKTDTIERMAEVFDDYTLGYDISTPYSYGWSTNVPVANTIAYDLDEIGDIVEHINQCMGKIEEIGYDPNAMVMHPKMKTVLRGLRDDMNRPLYVESLTNGRLDYTVYGVPTTFTRRMAGSGSPAVHEILMADRSTLVIGDKLALEIKLLDQATVTDEGGDLINLAEQDSVALRFRVRKAFGIRKDDLLAKITGV